MGEHVEILYDNNGIKTVKWKGPNGSTIVKRGELKDKDTVITAIFINDVVKLLRKAGVWVVEMRSYAPGE